MTRKQVILDLQAACAARAIVEEHRREMDVIYSRTLARLDQEIEAIREELKRIES